MNTPITQLFQVLPREQVGSQTGKLFEYQYHQAAAAALKLLDSAENAVCVYCEWHDDYVTEGYANGLYTFFQVKTLSDGPWGIGEFFGLGKPNGKTGLRPLSKKKSCIFSNLWDHTQKFDGRCQAFVFLSDAEVASDLKGLCEECKTAKSPQDFSAKSLTIFNSILPSLSRREKKCDAATLFSFFQRLHIEKGVGTVDSIDDAKLIIVDRILDASEVKLEWSEGRKMGNDLVAMVRSRSHCVLSTLPPSSNELRALKGLTISDVLKLLSLSEDGFRLLSEGAGEAVKTLSRLHRYCQKHGIQESLIPNFCGLKTRWSSWWVKHAELIDALDFAVFKNDCLEILQAHSDQNTKISKLGEQAKSLSAKYIAIFNPMEPLSPECVMGYFITLAVEAER
jgi:hypothetical protein